MHNVIILFGVSGCGKSLIGNQLSKDLQFEFIEGDDFHSNENIKKMKNNIPLNDDDREAWLDQINKEKCCDCMFCSERDIQKKTS